MYLYQTEFDRDRRVTLVSDRVTWFDSGRRVPCHCPEDIWKVCKDVLHLDQKTEEYVWGLFFDAKEHLMGMSEVSHGTADQAYLQPREVYIRALLAGTVDVVIVHNHPSGDASPSELDQLATERIAKAGSIIGVNLIDHLIIGNGQYYSFKEQDPTRLEVQS